MIDTALLGIVANGIKLRRGGRYGYGYYGGYYGAPAEQAPGPAAGSAQADAEVGSAERG